MLVTGWSVHSNGPVGTVPDIQLPPKRDNGYTHSSATPHVLLFQALMAYCMETDTSVR